MKKTAILLVGLGIVALSLASSSRVYAQRGPVEIGDTATYIYPSSVEVAQGTVFVITGPAGAPKAVGDCTDRGSVASDPGLVGPAGMPTQVAFFPADIVPRKLVDNVWIMQPPSGKTEVGISYPGYMGFKDLKPGWVLGSGRLSGNCGPGFSVAIFHLIAGPPGAVNQFYTLSQKK